MIIIIHKIALDLNRGRFILYTNLLFSPSAAVVIVKSLAVFVNALINLERGNGTTLTRIVFPSVCAPRSLDEAIGAGFSQRCLVDCELVLDFRKFRQ